MQIRKAGFLSGLFLRGKMALSSPRLSTPLLKPQKREMDLQNFLDKTFYLVHIASVSSFIPFF